jgi:hypothetical protein
MAGPSVVVRVLGDVTGLAKSFGSAASHGSDAAKGLHNAFQGVLSTLNSTGVLGPFGEALSGIDEAVSRVAEHGKAIGPAMMGVGGALAGIGVGLAALGSKDQAAHQQLQAAVAATGHSYDDYEGQVEKAIKSQEKFGNTASQTQDALAALTQATGDPAKALQYLGTASDLAAAKHESLTTAATQLGRAYNGNAKLLKDFGLTALPKATTATKALETATKQAQAADKALASAKQHLIDIEALDAGKKKLTTSEAIRLRDAQQKVADATLKAQDAHKKLAAAQDTAKQSAHNQSTVMTELSQKLHGQASAAADSFGGKLNALKARVEDAAATFGQKYGPAITAAGAAMGVLGGAISAGQGIMKSFSSAQKGVADAAKVASAAEDVEAASSWAALGPILLIIGAVVALVAIGYVLYRNWGTIWGFIKKIVADVWNWIKANWPLLLGILLGPIGLAAALIYKYWSQILGGIQAVWHWIASAWGSVYSFLVTPVSAAIRWIAGAWGAVVGAVGSVVSWIRSTWGTLYGALTSTISAAVGWIRGAWNGITSTVQGVVNGIEGIFNGLVGFIAGIPGKVANVASHAFDSLLGAARGAVNGVIGIWNTMAEHTALNFSVGGQKVGPVTLPKLDIHTGQLIPDIPKLAQGGLITSTGLVLAHAGEVISPTPKGLGGPAVLIQQANFATELDVGGFMRQVAWVVRTRAV